MSEAAVPLPSPAPPAAAASRWQADLALVVAAFFFGTTFLVVQDAVARADPLPFLAARFLLAGAVLAALGRRRPASPGELRHGLAAGGALLAGYVLQTIGLQYTTPSTSAFVTYLLVVFVPLLSFALLGRRPHPLTLVGLVLAVAGLVLLTGGADATFGRGEVLTLGCAVAFAAHIVILGETAGRHDAVRLTCVQVTTVGGICLVASLAAGDLALPGPALLAAAFTGVFATALAFFAMVWSQRVVSPSRAALILLLEPVFAALLAWLAGDGLPATTAAGGVLILAAVVVAEVVPAWRAPADLAARS
ncbi:MAG TPA: DMT family transporter [Acidimicrobiales bacterium]|nr:DMT family transporter [Acidimicrobiales bacterium]